MQEGMENLNDLLTMLVFHSNDLSAIEEDLREVALPTLQKINPELSTSSARTFLIKAKNDIEDLIVEIKNTLAQ